jgi:predicted transcriptional regulator
MPKIDATISEDLKKLLEELAEETGQSLSGIAADCLKTGAYAEVESRNKIAIFRKMRREKKKLEEKE